MKFLLFLFLPAVMACSHKKNTSADINFLNASSFNFFKVETGNTIPLSASESNILYAFGEPGLKNAGVSAKNSFPCVKWIYKGAVIDLQAGRMVDIILTNATYGFLVNGKVIKVGENIHTLETSFPDSYSRRSNQRVLVGLHYNGEPVQSHILFDFNARNEITSISLAN